MQIKLVDLPVMWGVMVLGEVVDKVLGARIPAHIEVSFFHLVACVKVAHLKYQGVLLLNCTIGNTLSGCIVAVSQGGRLRMSQFGKHDAKNRSFSHIEKQCAEFCFGG